MSGPRASRRPLQNATSSVAPKGRIVIGHHAAVTALRVNGSNVSSVWLEQDTRGGVMEEIEGLARQHNVPIQFKPKAQMDGVIQGHQNVILFAPPLPEFSWPQVERAPEALVIVLDGIEDPHNLGAIVRTAWLMGALGVIIPSVRAVGVTPTVGKVASGGVEYVPVEAVTNLESALDRLKKHGFWVYGLDADASSSPLWDAQLHEKSVLVIGGEDRGLRIATKKQCDALVQIPQIITAASLNASVAAALSMYEWRRARKTLTEKTRIK